MNGWGNTARSAGWREPRRRERVLPSRGRGWTTSDVAILVVCFVARWELGMAFLALKFWHQASGYDGSTLAFARLKWNGLVALARAVSSGGSLPSFGIGTRSSGNLAFDSWREGELERISVERRKLQDAEREFTRYRDDLIQARDREAFDRFIRSRQG